MKTIFSKIEEGQRFKPYLSKRNVTCLKVGNTYIEGGALRNAVILLGDADQPAKDLGSLLFFLESSEVVLVSKEKVSEDLDKDSSNSICLNCQNLSASNSKIPATPEGGDRNDKLHICPNDKNKWEQFNIKRHLWRQITSNRDWEILSYAVKIKSSQDI
ncbi:MAG: hypothetical protein ISR98_01975 [Parcubacteria group bacterium]|nr:hypothetical protein [Parcubacteria group bacterium]